MTKTIALSKNYSTIIDKEDYEKIKEHKVFLNSQSANYHRAYILINGKYILLHRFILGLDKSNKYQVDHINRDPLDNRKSNLRLATRSQNQNNKWSISNRSSVFKGVVKSRNRIFWESENRLKKIKIRSAQYYSEKFAYLDYCEYKIKESGEYFYYKDLYSFPLEVVQPRKANSSTRRKLKYKGVSKNKNFGTFRANINLDGKQVFLGIFKSEIAAAKAYDKAAFKKDGFFSRLNFPEEYRIFL